MKRGMTRRELEVTDLVEITEILDKSKIIHVAMVDEGEPYMSHPIRSLHKLPRWILPKKAHRLFSACFQPRPYSRCR